MRIWLILLAGCCPAEMPATVEAPPDLGPPPPPQCERPFFALEPLTGGPGGAVDLTLAAPASGSIASARFYRDATVATSFETVGPCRRYGSVTASYGEPASAGTLIVVGGEAPVVLRGDGAAFLPADGRMWSGGEALLFQSTGAEVPPWQLALYAPPSLQLGGLPPVGQALHLRRGEPIDVTWKPADGWLAISIGDDLAGAWCLFPAADGAAEIPAALTEKLPAPAYLPLTARTLCNAVAVAGDFRIAVEAAAWACEQRWVSIEP